MTIRSKQWYTNISRLPNSFVNVSIGRLPCSRLTTRSSDRRPVVSKFQIFLASISSFTRNPWIARFVLLATIPAVAFAGTSFLQHNLVSDIPGLADQTDPNLVNPWGIAYSATGPFWIANNHSGSTTVYNGSGQPFPAANPLLIQIPASAGSNPPSAPTGQ